MNPGYPIYIISKGRWETRLTAKSLEKMNVPYLIVVEKQEYENYANVIDKNKILILPQKYLDEYDTCDDLEATKSKGPGAARNFCWEHSIQNNADWHWVMDDNINGFTRLNQNLKVKVGSGTIFKVCEDFVNRYENISIAGLNYEMFVKRKDTPPPFVLNTRIYSCLLIKNSIPFRWRGRYNEDTDLSLRVLKNGDCTLQFNAFLCNKVTTQRMKGGNTTEFYEKEGTFNKSKMLVDLHPDVSRMLWKFDRHHHYVDYGAFKKNRLIKKDIIVPPGVNNYGMKLIEVNNE